MSRIMLCLCAFIFLMAIHTAHAQTAFAQSAFGDPQEQVAEGGGGLIAVEPDIQAGSIPVGSTSQVIVRFRNESARPIEFRDINLYPSSTISANVGVNECATEPLTSGAECAVIVGVKGLQPGNWRVEMLVRHTGRARLVTSRINGTIETSEENVNISTDIEVTPSPIDFGTLEASRPIIRSLTIRNITAAPINIKDMFIDAPAQSGYDLRTDCESLTSGQACIASILWSPVVQGPSSGFLVIRHDGASALTNVPLSGEFEPEDAEQANIFPSTLPGKGVLVSSETEINFGTGINSQSAITVSLVNVGDAPLTFNAVALAGSENGLTLQETGCAIETELQPTEACPLTVSWSPTKQGAVIDDVNIRHTGARGVLVLPVRGTASEAVNANNRPIFMTQTGESSRNVDTSEGAESQSESGIGRGSGQPVLDGYVVTSHSAKHAIIRGPVGSRIVADGKKTIIGGFEWEVEIIDVGVRLTSGANVVILVFDRSLSSGSSGNASRNTGGGGGE